MILDPSLALEAVLAGAVTTNQPAFHVDYIDYNSAGMPTVPTPARGVLNSTTDVTLLAAPPAGIIQSREVLRLEIYNRDTANIDVTVKTDDGTNERIKIRKTIQSLDSLVWEKGVGWYTTATGAGIFTNLTVTGTSTLTGAVTMGSTLAVTGAATLSSTLGVTGLLTTGAAGITGSGPIITSYNDSSATSLQLTGTNAGVGITIGGDTNVYRLAANTLATDDSLTIGADLSVLGGASIGNNVADAHAFTGAVTIVDDGFGFVMSRSGGGDRFKLFANTASGGTEIYSRNDADNAYAPLYLHGSAVITSNSGTEITRVTSTGLGVFCTPGVELDLLKSDSGAAVQVRVGNTSNTASSDAEVFTQVAGTSAGDPYFRCVISGGEVWAFGLDNSDSDKFKVSKSSALGTNDYLTIDTSGNVMVGKGTTDASVAGVALSQSGLSQFTLDGGVVMVVNRGTSDGDLISLRQANTEEGTISVSGNTVSYNAFLGSHWSQLVGKDRQDIPRGTVMESVDELCDWEDEENDRLPKCKISDTPASPSVYGVFLAWDEDELKHIEFSDEHSVLDIDGVNYQYRKPYRPSNDLYVAALGAAWVRMAPLAIVTRGDLVESAGNGCARAQLDPLVKSSTVGKVNSAAKVKTYPDGSYLVPCTLMCG